MGFRVSSDKPEYMTCPEKTAYHLESDVNSGWKAVARMFPCRTATITRSLEYTSSCESNALCVSAQKRCSNLEYVLGKGFITVVATRVLALFKHFVS
jgi:hypothetical protein